MNIISFQLGLSTLALAALLGSAGASATDLATLPLKASVLAKPNVIFGLDDSGSMDSEVLLGNNDGALWWDYNAGSGWSATGVTHFNSAGNAGTQWRKMVYLFPNGTGTGNRVYGDAATAHYAILPTAQFAFVRSPDYNPLYYNPATVYAPWSPANAPNSPYGNASTTAAKSHPVYGTGTFDVKNTRAANTGGDQVFTALPGMTLPAGAQKNECDVNNANCAGWTAVGASDVAAAANRVTRVAMAYFPATYYRKEACTVDGTSCVTAPDGTTTLKRHEIKPANYGTTAEYDAAIQNFANWFTYYRKRKLMLNAAMGQVLEPLTGLMMGAIRFNSRPGTGTRITMYDLDATSSAANGRKLAGFFYETNGDGGTPTRETLQRIGQEYADANGPIKYACQRNNAFIVTDGFANVSNISPPPYSKATWGVNAPYETTYDYSLANLALGYYTLNPRPTMATGKVKATATDTNPNLHVNTYGLTIGSRGLLFDGDASVPPTSAAAWTNPTQTRHPSSVDDLWHAAINGRGKMYLASTPAETAEKIQSGLKDILSQIGAQGGIAVSTVNLSRGDSRAYFGAYNPAGWAGDLAAREIDPATGVVGAEVWRASDILSARDWNTRVIGSASTGAGLAFTAGDVGALVNPGNVYGDTTQVMNYLRGDRSLEGSTFRTRVSLIGAVINSEPVISREENMVYVQSGEGMLHAFDITKDANAGREMWAFVPRSILANIGETVQRSYAFGTQLDGSPVVGKVAASTKLLVAGTGVAGRSFHAIDVTNPRDLTEAQLAARYRWEFPAAGDATTQAKVGQAVGRPLIVKTKNDGYVVLLSSGYNNADGKGRLWMLNPSNGAILKEYTTPDVSGLDMGLAQVTAFGETDGSVRYVYGGDLLGNVWRFDLDDASSTPSAFKLAVLKNASGQTQPVTAAPELIVKDGKRIVIVGTGRLLDLSDFGSSEVQSLYVIADGAYLPNARLGLVKQTYVRATDTLTNLPVDWASDRGWYIDLTAGEQINTRPTIAYGAVAFVGNTNGGSDCSASSYLYVLDVLSGGKYAGTDFASTLISDTANSSAVTALRTVDGKIVGSGQDADGNPWERKISNAIPITPAKNSWMEIRR